MIIINECLANLDLLVQYSLFLIQNIVFCRRPAGELNLLSQTGVVLRPLMVLRNIKKSQLVRELEGLFLVWSSNKLFSRTDASENRGNSSMLPL